MAIKKAHIDVLAAENLELAKGAGEVTARSRTEDMEAAVRRWTDAREAAMKRRAMDEQAAFSRWIAARDNADRRQKEEMDAAARQWTEDMEAAERCWSKDSEVATRRAASENPRQDSKGNPGVPVSQVWTCCGIL